jgi:predicted ribosomally synthesized peptide with nif11-like leader
MPFIFIKDALDMQTESVQAFNDRVAASPELQTKLRAATSPLAFLDLAKAEGLELTSQDFHLIVQQAYQQWIKLLDPKMSSFFSRVHSEKELDQQLRVCRSNAEVISLAQQCGIELSEDDLQQSAQAAEAVPGFSFEKLWFRGLGLIGG